MIGLYINFFELVLFGFILYNSKKPRADVFLVLSIYTISALLAFFFDPSSIPGFESNPYYNNWFFILYGILIIYSLSPLYYLTSVSNRLNLNQIKITRNVKYSMVIAGLGAVYSVIYQLPYAFISLATGAAEVRNNLNNLDQSVLPETVFTTIAVAFSTFFPLYIVFLFISIKQKLPFIYKFLMFMGSISYLVSSFCFTARDGIIFYIFFIILFTINFWKFFSLKTKQRLGFTLFLLIAVNVLILVSFTQSRFGSNTKGTIGYIAEQPYVFAKNLEIRTKSDKYYGPGLRFPLFSNLFTTARPITRSEPYEWSFGTFLTDFFNINGYSSLIILTVLFISFFTSQIKRSASINPLAYLVIYTLYIHFIISGVFYFRLGSFSGNIYLVVMIIIYFYLKKSKRSYQ